MPPMSLDDWKELPRRRLESRELGSDPVSERIAYALDNGLSVEILYASTDNLTRRTVWPKHIHRVKTDRYGTTYLRAYCETRGEDRTFRLDRIREARVPDGPPELASVAKAPQKPSSDTRPTQTNRPGVSRTPTVAKSGGCLLPAIGAVVVAFAALAAAAAALS